MSTILLLVTVSVPPPAMPAPSPPKFREMVVPSTVSDPEFRIAPPVPLKLAVLPVSTASRMVNVPAFKIPPPPSVVSPSVIVSPEMPTVAPVATVKMR